MKENTFRKFFENSDKDKLINAKQSYSVLGSEASKGDLAWNMNKKIY